MVVHTYNPSYSKEVETGRTVIQSQPGQKCKTISTKKLSIVACAYNPSCAGGISKGISVQVTPSKKINK
jgi:hypothetical protein